MQNQLALGSFKQPGELSSWLRMLVPSWNKFLHTYLLPNIFLENKISRKQEEDAKWVYLPASCSLILDVHCSVETWTIFAQLFPTYLHCDNHCMIGFERNQSFPEDRCLAFKTIAPFTHRFLRVFSICVFSLENTLVKGCLCDCRQILTKITKGM